MQRRSFLRGVVATSTAISLSGGASAATSAAATTTEVWPLFDPLGPDSEVGLGWRLESLSDLRRGALVLALRHDGGRRAELHLCRRGHEPRGIAHTAELDLVLMNDGDGTVHTDESLGRVIKTLARLIAKNVRHTPSGLLAHGQRINAHGPRRILE